MIQLIPMAESDFQTYLQFAIQDYAEQNIKAGTWDPSEATEKAKQQFKMLLPQGLASKNQHIFSVVDEALGSKVGVIWFMQNDKGAHPIAFICDLLIFEEFRRRGYGTQALTALEEKVREMGIDTILLNVFAHNHAARSLYEKMGYGMTNIYMLKKLAAK